MTPAKKVDFIERVSKSVLGLEGLQIVVYCDRNRFGELSNERVYDKGVIAWFYMLGFKNIYLSRENPLI